MIDVQPGFYEGVDRYEQACRYHTLNEQFIMKRYQVSLSRETINPITYYYLLQMAD